MKISIATSALRPLFDGTPQSLIQAYQSTGFTHFDYGFDGFFDENSEYRDAKFESGLHQVREQAERQGADFVMAHAPYKYNPCRSSEEFEAQVADTQKAIYGCSILGIDRMTVHAGFGFVESMDDMLKINQKYFRMLLPDAEKYGVTLMMENIAEEIYQRKFVVENADTMLILKQMLENHPLLRVCWDTGHANVKNLDQYANIAKLKGELYGLHIQDNNGYHDDHMPPLMGTVNYDEVLKGLLDIGYDGPFNLESHVLNNGRTWPNYRREFTEASKAQARLFDPDDALRIYGVQLMYHLAEYMLKKYDIPVE